MSPNPTGTNGWGTTRPMEAEEERFWRKVTEVPSGCWEWQGALGGNGYGQFHLTRTGRQVGAHRYAYEHMVGPVPEGLQLDHLCRNKACVNPAHLEPVTGQVNTLRNGGPSAVNATKTFCPQGHPYDEANTCVKATGRRSCRACARAYARRKRQERAA